MALEGQQSLFGFPVTSDRKAPTRKTPARRRFPVTIQCQGCGQWFGSFVRGVRCDECRKEKRVERKEKPQRIGRVSEYGYIDQFPPGF